MIKNSFWFRHFLMCNDFANRVLRAKGIKYLNFAKLIQEERNGRIANSQMTIYFWIADEFISRIYDCENKILFECLLEGSSEIDSITMEQLASLEQHQLENYFCEYCVGIIKEEY